MTALPRGTTAMCPHGNTAPLGSSLHLCRSCLTGSLSPCCKHSLGCPGTGTAVRFLTCGPFCFPPLNLEMQKVQLKYLMQSCSGLGRIALVHAPVWWWQPGANKILQWFYNGNSVSCRLWLSSYSESSLLLGDTLGCDDLFPVTLRCISGSRSSSP